MRARRLQVAAVAGLAAIAALLAPTAASAQAVWTVHPLDPAYDDLAQLEALGLLGAVASSHRPYSVARIRWMLRDAHERLRLRADDPEARTGQVVLGRLATRFEPLDSSTGDPTAPTGDGSVGRPVFTADVELGGGRSPGRSHPPNGIGEIDAVANPLWAYRAGRAYGDELTAAASLGLAVPLGDRFAVAVGPRISALRSSGDRSGRDDLAWESAYVRAVFGRVALQVGRDAWIWGWGGQSGLMTSSNGPPVTLLRVSTDLPLVVPLFGPTDVTMVVADLGPRQNFPHAKLFGAKLSARPHASTEIGFAVLNKQMGEGAPDASFGRRFRDLTFLGRSYLISEKLVGLDARVLLTTPIAIEIRGETVFTDVDSRRLGDIADAEAGWAFGVFLPRLGAGGSHSLGLEGARIGPRVYRHDQYTTGHAVDGLAQGAEVGPDGRRLSFHYGYRPAPADWGARAALHADVRRADQHRATYTPLLDFVRTADLPDERRVRVELGVSRWWAGARARTDVVAGLERVRNFDYERDADRTNGSLLVRLWYAW